MKTFEVWATVVVIVECEGDEPSDTELAQAAQDTIGHTGAVVYSLESSEPVTV